MKSLLMSFLALVLLAAGCARFRHPAGPETFTIIALPDTQHYAASQPRIFEAQTAWIREQKEALNIVGVVHEGDITDGCTTGEWAVADRALSVLDGVVPYCLAPGNHDYGASKPAQRDMARFNHHFGPARFEGKAWYGGHYGDGNENAFYRLDAGRQKLIVICLEFGPRDEVLAWAGRVADEHPRDRAVVVTHSYMYSDDTRVGKGDAYSPHSYGCPNDGEEMWDKLVRKHANISLVLSGHILNDGLGRLVSTNDAGRLVPQVLANYQMRQNGGDGYLRILTFRPAEGKIAVSTYSPTLKLFATDPDNTFELPW